MKDNKAVWQVHNYDKHDLDELIRAGFDVWSWKNTNRLTIEGTPERMTYMFLTNKKALSCTFVNTPFPDPKYSSLAERITQ